MKLHLATAAAATALSAAPIPLTRAAVFPNEEARSASTARDFLAASSEQRRGRRRYGRRRGLAAADEEKRSPRPPPTSDPLLASDFGDVPGFYHGVASGSPTPDSVILWTRFTPRDIEDEVELELRLSEVHTAEIPLESLLDPSENPDLRVDRIAVGEDTDWTAKVDVRGLKPGTAYVYAFATVPSTAADGYDFISSPAGQTKTAPAADASEQQQLTYVLLSCAVYTNGYFHPYDVASTISDLDLIVHAGDYIYEYGSYSTYANDSKERVRKLMPEWETVSLQDYYRRYAIYRQDEGLQNLHRRAPMIAIWDDHEVADNDYGMGDDPSKAGANNHQPTCPADRTSSKLEKNAAQCDFDEGDIASRMENAYRAYLTWMPIRPNVTDDDNMGVVKGLGSLTQVVEWGDLATIVAFESRVSYRSEEPTLSSVFEEFAAFAENNTNVTQYGEEGSPVKEELDAVAANVRAKMWDPSFTMVGEGSVSLLEDKFRTSKMDGKPWQIFLSSTLLGPNVIANPATLWEVVPESYQQDVKSAMDKLLGTSLFLRIITAMAVTMTPWNRDDFNGFAHQRARILASFAKHANNAIVLGGDLHDSWGWVLREEDGGNGDDNTTAVPPPPVAVNIGAPGVTAPGIGRDVLAEMEPIDEALPSADGGWLYLAETWKRTNGPPYDLIQAEIRHSGFVAVRATRTEHVAEFYGIPADDMLMDYPEARNRSTDGNALTSRYLCTGRFVTDVAAPGSFVKEEGCGIEFDKESRPAEWSIPVPAPAGVGGDDYDGRSSRGNSLRFGWALSLLVPCWCLAVWFGGISA